MPEILQQLRKGALASIFALAAGGTLLLMMLVDTIEFAVQRPLYGIAAGILVLSAIGPLASPLTVVGQILLWNGVGWTIALAFFGLESVGALPLWPLMLAALALTFWPRTPETTLPPIGIAIALLGGFLICWLAWSDVHLPIPDSWLE